MQSLIGPKQLNLPLLSGWVTGVTNSLYLPFPSGSYLYQLITGSDEGTSVQVTGGSYLNFANFSGIGGAQVIQSGNNILVSGGAGGSGSITNIANVVYTSGTQTISGSKLFTFGETGANGAFTVRQLSSGPSSVGAYIGASNFVSQIGFIGAGSLYFLTGGNVNLESTNSLNLTAEHSINEVSKNILLNQNSATGFGILSGNWSTNTVPTQSGNLINKGYLDAQTGNLTAQFYPLLSNPSGYLNSGNPIVSGNLTVNGNTILGNNTGDSVILSGANLYAPNADNNSNDSLMTRFLTRPEAVINRFNFNTNSFTSTATSGAGTSFTAGFNSVRIDAASTTQTGAITASYPLETWIGNGASLGGLNFGGTSFASPLWLSFRVHNGGNNAAYSTGNQNWVISFINNQVSPTADITTLTPTVGNTSTRGYIALQCIGSGVNLVAQNGTNVAVTGFNFDFISGGFTKDYVLYSNGSGNLSLFQNRQFLGSITGSPTGSTAPVLYINHTANAVSSATQRRLYFENINAVW